MFPLSSFVKFGIIGLIFGLFGCSMSTSPNTAEISRDSLSTILVEPKWLVVDAASRVFVGDYYKGVYRSIDHGQHWVALDVGNPSGIQEFTSTGSALYLSGYVQMDTSANFYLWRSDTGGNFWHRFALPMEGILSLTPWAGDTLYAGTVRGLWWSNDQSMTWTQAALYSVVVVDVCRNATDTRYAISSGTMSGAIYRKLVGEGWKQIRVTSPLSDLLCTTSGKILIGRPRHDEAPGGLLSSEDNGETWSEVPVFNGAAVETLLELPSGVLLAGGETGLWRSTDAGTSWQQTLADWRANSLAYDASINRIYAGVWRVIHQQGVSRIHATIRWSDDAGRSWQ